MKRQRDNKQRKVNLIAYSTVTGLVCVAFLFVSPQLSRAADSEFLWIDGIQGNATNGTQTGWIECLSFENVLATSPYFEVVLTNAPIAMLDKFWIDKNAIQQVRLDVVQPNGNVFLEYTLAHALITSVEENGVLTDVRIAYEEIEWSYPPPPPFQITSILSTNAHDLFIVWNTSVTSNIVQVTRGMGTRGNFSTNAFTDVTNIVSTTTTTNFLDVGALTNGPARYYRVRTPQPSTVYIGNSLTVTNGGADGVPPLVILGEYSSAGPLATSATILSNGTIQDVKFYGQNYNFTLYALSYGGVGTNADEQTFQVTASERFAGSVASPGIHTVPISGFAINAGELLAFAGTGPYYSQNPDDAPNSDATYENSSSPGSFTATPPGRLADFTVGLHLDTTATYDYISDSHGNQGRNYAIGVDVLPQ